MTPAIRPARRDDEPELIDLWVEAWQIAMPGIDFDCRRSWLAARLHELEECDVALLVAIQAEKPIGFVTVDPLGTVDQLVVAVDYQGQGTARALVAAARARVPRGLRLSVNRDNAVALRFYERQGFSVVGEGTNPLSGLPILHLTG